MYAYIHLFSLFKKENKLSTYNIYIYVYTYIDRDECKTLLIWWKINFNKLKT